MNLFGYFEMLREDIVSVSQRLLMPISALQKMPLDQIAHVSDMIRSPPEIFRVASKNVPIEALLGRIIDVS